MVAEPEEQLTTNTEIIRQRALKTTDKQYILIVEFMESHPTFAAGRIKCADGKGQSDQ